MERGRNRKKMPIMSRFIYYIYFNVAIVYKQLRKQYIVKETLFMWPIFILFFFFVLLKIYGI